MTIPPELLRNAPRDVSMSWGEMISIAAFGVGVPLYGFGRALWSYSHDHSAASLVFVSLLALEIFWYTARTIRNTRRDMEILSTGRPVVAVTTGNAKKRWFGRWGKYRVECEFQLRDGRPGSATVFSDDFVVADSERVIVYDRDQPWRVVAYPASCLTVHDVNSRYSRNEKRQATS